ncbi:hypothetical protein CC1G_08898 [Coprinopsis cinerea okayama7|uniref:F-box domain-containing protein n=1 Tax=Coprinopsis cinerea (strain Okayama-7 / 130 / ATCC MYA-4618 / FGSC 9003) TaxID=240176 RepID=A8P887_COPC7|nr:hypothetical protein CC1G_08898 [Coprinopsis cinerea okayama7\|eukprot:XP_001839519.2 hypothetical protein CC1G_08898 [Coprinopsis cinerea okayama7\
MSTSRPFPPELVSAVLSYVYLSKDQELLKTCMKVSTEWHQESLPFAFRDLTIPPPILGLSPCNPSIDQVLQRLLDLLEDNPQLAVCVRNLHLDLKSGTWATQVAESKIFPLVANKLGLLETFRLELTPMYRNTITWLLTSREGVKEAIKRVFSLPTLTSLEIGNVFVPWEFWGFNQNLRNFTLRMPDIQIPSVGPYPTPDRPVAPIQRLTITKGNTLEWMAFAHPYLLAQVQAALLYMYVYRQDRSAIQAFLNETGGSLQTLELITYVDRYERRWSTRVGSEAAIPRRLVWMPKERRNMPIPPFERLDTPWRLGGVVTSSLPSSREGDRSFR